MWKLVTFGIGPEHTKQPIDIINGGYRVRTDGLGPLSPREFKHLEGDKAYSVLHSFDELLDAGKLLGPFEPNSVEPKGFVAFFLREKPGRFDSQGRKVYRLILDASRECLLYDFQKDLLLSWLDFKHTENQNFPRNYLDLEGGLKCLITMAKKDTGVKSTINDFINSVDLEMDYAHQIIGGLKSCSYLAKADLKRGFRQIITDDLSHLYTYLKTFIKHPHTGKVHQFWLSDPTAC